MKKQRQKTRREFHGLKEEEQEQAQVFKQQEGSTGERRHRGGQAGVGGPRGMGFRTLAFVPKEMASPCRILSRGMT